MAGIATLIVLAIWLAFYFFVFVPAGCAMTEEFPLPGFPCDSSASRRASKRRWATFAVAIVWSSLWSWLHSAVSGIRPCRRYEIETIDPATLHLSGEFVESNLGSAVEPDGSVTVRIVGQQYSFTPQCMLVPADTPITFRATSPDAIHGFLIEGTQHQHHADARLHLLLARALRSARRAFDAMPGILRRRPCRPCGRWCR